MNRVMYGGFYKLKERGKAGVSANGMVIREREGKREAPTKVEKERERRRRRCRDERERDRTPEFISW